MLKEYLPKIINSNEADLSIYHVTGDVIPAADVDVNVEQQISMN